MADRKITDLTALTTPASADVLPIVDVSEAAAADKNKKITVGELFKGVPDGTAAAPAIAFESDDGNGIFLSTTDTVGIATNGSSRMTVSTTAVTSTLPVIVPDGTAAAPSVAFTGSGTDTGVYSPGVDQVAISTGGTGRLFVDASGRVGVGTSPNRLLHIKSADPILKLEDNDPDGVYGQIDGSSGNLYLIADGGNSSASSFIAFRIDGEGSSSEKLRITSDGKVGVGTSSPLSGAQLTVAGAALAVTGGNTDHSANSIRIGEEGSGLAQIRCYGPDTSTKGSLKFTMSASDGTSNADVVIDSSGRVGINTASPTSKLTITETANANGIEIRTADSNFSQLALGINTSINAAYLQSSASGSGTARDLAFYGNSGEWGRFDTSGRLLVGTSSARADFVSGTQTPQIQLEGTSAENSCLSLTRNSNDNGTPGLYFGKSRGTGDGGTTLVASGDTVGNIEFHGADGDDLVRAADIRCVIDGTPGANDMPGRLVFSTTADGASSPTEHLRIKENGQSNFYSNLNTSTIELRNGTTSGSVHRLLYGLHSATNNTNGTAIYSIFTNGTVGTPSDIRLKKNVESTRDGYLEDVANLRVVKYHWKTQDDSEPKELGLIAQEVEQVFPGLIRTEGEGENETKELKRSVIPFILLKALQEAQLRIETLEAKVAALEAQ